MFPHASIPDRICLPLRLSSDAGTDGDADAGANMRLTILTTGGTIDKTYNEFDGSLANS